MTKKYWLRSILFNITFTVMSFCMCLICLPAFFLPRAHFMQIVRFWTWLVYQCERFILGLHFEIRGLENLPPAGSYIVASKHQSPYETFKLHMLFGDPAIILKQELLKIPLWGAYLKKTDVIAIDRSSPDAAIESIQTGARRMMAQNRPIVIFPQGTRTSLEQTTRDKPYKVGVARIQEATGLPIIPMALNTGYFWPKHGFFKRPGRVIFEFLPAIEASLERSDLLQKLEEAIEPAAESLLQNAIQAEENKPKKSRLAVYVFSIAAALPLLTAAAYIFWWFHIAGIVREEYGSFLRKPEQIAQLESHGIYNLKRFTSESSVTGFPDKIIIQARQEQIQSSNLAIITADFKAWGSAFLTGPIEFETGKTTISNINIPEPIIFDAISSRFTLGDDFIALEYFTFTQNAFKASIAGDIYFAPEQAYPNMDLTLTIQNSQDMIDNLQDDQIINAQNSAFTAGILQSFTDKNGVTSIPLRLQNKKLYIGPLQILSLP